MTTGSGKTFLSRRVGSFLSNLGWIVLQSKFERTLEHQSRDVICSLLDKLVSKLIEMKEGGVTKDAEYSERAATAILKLFDTSSLLELAEFIPNITNFIEGIETDNKDSHQRLADFSQWRLIFLVSKLLSAILRLDRHVMIILDDLHWCDASMLLLIKEVITSVSQHEKEKQHLLFIGTYRDMEVNDQHPLTSQLVQLHQNNNVNVTQMKLSCLLADDVSDMLEQELRLPKRYVTDLANIVHSKTSGHALYIVEFLNSLLRDSQIAYSPQKRRLDWDLSKVSSTKTGDNVASIIISNLTALEPAVLWTMCVLSCFGMKIEIKLLHSLQGSTLMPEGGFNISSLVEGGFVSIEPSNHGPVVVFTHDLIQQNVCDKIPEEKRQKLHLELGTFLASKTTLDTSWFQPAIEAGMEQLFICDRGDGQGDDSSQENEDVSVLSLAGIATSQINKAGLEVISDQAQRIRFARWNLHVSKELSSKSNFRSSIYYCKHGISFLGQDPWQESTCELSIELHEGMARALFAVGKIKEVKTYANAIIDSEKVPFDRSLAAHLILIRSLETTGEFRDTVARGLEVLRQLKFNMPATPSPTIVLQSMAETSLAASQYNFTHISNLPQAVHPEQRSILKIIDSVAVACFRSTSPLLPVVASSTVMYSIQNGLCHCEEAASGEGDYLILCHGLVNDVFLTLHSIIITLLAFSIFGYFKVFLEGRFDEGSKGTDTLFACVDLFHNIM